MYDTLFRHLEHGHDGLHTLDAEMALGVANVQLETSQTTVSALVSPEIEKRRERTGSWCEPNLERKSPLFPRLNVCEMPLYAFSSVRTRKPPMFSTRVISGVAPAPNVAFRTPASPILRMTCAMRY